MNGRSILRPLLAMALVLIASNSALAQAFNTTDSTCTVVNGNIYADRQAVYLNGNPSALADGVYCVKVVAPGGTLLGQSIGPTWAFDPAHRVCAQLWSLVNKASDGTQGYDVTTNSGGEYKVIISLDCTFGAGSKDDNFKVRVENCVSSGVPVFDNCTDGTTDLGCNPGTIPGCDSTVTAHDNCGPLAVNCSSDPDTGTGCGIRTHTVVYTATNSVGTTTCTKTYTYTVDTESPVIHCPDNITVNPPCDETSASVTFAATATDNCDANPSIKYYVGGVEITSPHTFSGGVTTVTAIATDACGNHDDSCTFTVTVNTVPCETVTITKVNGATGGPLAGFKFRVCYYDPRVPAVQICVTTDPSDVNGQVLLTIPQGSPYEICEIQPTTGTSCYWLQTSPASSGCFSGTADSPVSVTFENICVCPSLGEGTLGLWSNKNGQAILCAHFPEWRDTLNALCLVDANGNSFDIIGATCAIAYGNFKTWLMGKNAVNMAYMLSVQLATNVLDGLYRNIPGDANVVLTPALAACYGSTTANIQAVRDEANTLLCNNSSDRAREECLKSILDALNNGSLPRVSDGACPIIYP